LREAGRNAVGGTLYVALEPCNHYGRTPPCTDAILAAGLSRVVVAMSDPNPGVKGGGTDRLREGGVLVELGLLEEAAFELNRAYVKHVTKRLPWFALKTAMTMDGKIASSTGQSQWITCQKSRQSVHRLRQEAACILSGRGTISSDDPSFTVRLPGRKEKFRTVVIADSLGRSPLKAKVFQVRKRKAATLLAVTSKAPREKLRAMQDQGVEILHCGEGPSIDPLLLASALGERGINHVFVEAGGVLNASVLKAGLVDEVHVFIGPLVLGGKDAPTPIEGEGWGRIAEAPRMYLRKMRRMGSDVWLQYRRLEAEA